MYKIKNKKSTKTINPKTAKDKRYIRNELSLHQAINRILAKRRVGVRSKEVCHAANISRPTLYAHCRNVDDALSIYEEQILTEFTPLIPKKNRNHETTFIILLNFIHRHKTYFAATLKNHNAWLLAQLINDLRPILVSKNINDKCYDIYCGSLATLIFCWYKHESFDTEKIPLYTKKLVQVRVIDLGI